jgi:hypothetical protein
MIYGGPTYRFCRVCDILTDLNYDEAESVRAKLLSSSDQVIKKIAGKPNNYGFSHVNASGETAFQYFYEGPAVMYPEFGAKFADDLKVRGSVTVCVPPHHSKIWVRISMNDEKIKEGINDTQIAEFFSKSNEAAERFSGLLMGEYALALKECGIAETLEAIHKIKIETSSADLSRLIDIIDKDTFRMSMLLEDEELFRQIIGFLMRTYKKDISEIEAMKLIPKDYKWIKLKLRSEEYRTIGLYSKYHSNNESTFSGLVHLAPEMVGKIIGSVSKEFSKKLVQHLAPVI